MKKKSEYGALAAAVVWKALEDARDLSADNPDRVQAELFMFSDSPEWSEMRKLWLGHLDEVGDNIFHMARANGYASMADRFYIIPGDDPNNPKKAVDTAYTMLA